MNVITQREAVERIGQSQIDQSECVAGLRMDMRQFAFVVK